MRYSFRCRRIPASAHIFLFLQKLNHIREYAIMGIKVCGMWKPR
ncbi:hypothetical protein HMPREF9163_00901 [Selenomonas sp. oral taxon 138 str. F0429]|nr:hypothetical protein HMPREF9163_00901 [Selenomonas sp. oral taxon 138 str. F0429]